MTPTPSITVKELQELRQQHVDHVLLDVREPVEHAISHLDGLFMPMAELLLRFEELPKDKPIIVHCRGGGRSKRATDFLLAQGFLDVRNLTGGIKAWAAEIDPSLVVG